MKKGDVRFSSRNAREVGGKTRNPHVVVGVKTNLEDGEQKRDSFIISLKEIIQASCTLQTKMQFKLCTFM